MSSTSAENARIKLMFTKFSCSMKKGAGRPYQRVLLQKALIM